MFLPICILASSDTLSIQEHNSIHGHNYRPIIKIKERSNMHRLHKVNEKEAEQIVQKTTQEELLKLKLTHLGNKLIYRCYTKNYILVVNALNGNVISKEKK